MEQTSSRWPNAIAHIDADCFYVACEYLKDPRLKGKIVGVLSSQDACIVSKSYEAKKAGVKTGMPIWEARKIIPNGIWIPADFEFYGKVSKRMFDVMREISPEVEVYSIDEGFVGLNGMQALYRCDPGEIGQILKDRIYEEVGVSVSVGVSITKTLAKMASEKNKPNGLTVIDALEVDSFLINCGIQEIWGIGYRRTPKLLGMGIKTAKDFANADVNFIRKKLSKQGSDLWYELHGKNVFKIQLVPPLPKSIARTSSLGSPSGEKDYIWAKLSYHIFRLCSTMVSKRIATKKIVFFLGVKDKKSINCEIKLDRHTNSYSEIIIRIREEFEKCFIPFELYRKCGVSATDIIENAKREADIFGKFIQDQKQEKIIQAVRKINKKYGHSTLLPGVQMKLKQNQINGVMKKKKNITFSGPGPFVAS